VIRFPILGGGDKRMFMSCGNECIGCRSVFYIRGFDIVLLNRCIGYFVIITLDYLYKVIRVSTIMNITRYIIMCLYSVCYDILYHINVLFDVSYIVFLTNDMPIGIINSLGNMAN